MTAVATNAVLVSYVGSATMERPAAPTSQTYYKMQGYRYNHQPPDVETWVSEGSPDPVNPSGDPIRGVRCVATWVA